jgi:hypothetical protein
MMHMRMQFLPVLAWKGTEPLMMMMMMMNLGIPEFNLGIP